MNQEREREKMRINYRLLKSWFINSIFFPVIEISERFHISESLFIPFASTDADELFFFGTSCFPFTTFIVSSLFFAALTWFTFFTSGIILGISFFTSELLLALSDSFETWFSSCFLISRRNSFYSSINFLCSSRCFSSSFNNCSCFFTMIGFFRTLISSLNFSLLDLTFPFLSVSRVFLQLILVE